MVKAIPFRQRESKHIPAINTLSSVCPRRVPESSSHISEAVEMRTVVVTQNASRKLQNRTGFPVFVVVRSNCCVIIEGENVISGLTQPSESETPPENATTVPPEFKHV